MKFKSDPTLLHTHTALHTETAGRQLISTPCADRATRSRASTPADGFEQRVDAGKRGSRQGQARDSQHFPPENADSRTKRPAADLADAGERDRGNKAWQMVHESDHVARHAPREREKAVCGFSDWRARDRVRGERLSLIHI